MFRLGDLKTNSHLCILRVRVLSHKVLDGKGVQNIFVVFSLMVLAELVGHDNSADCVLRLASL